MPVKYKHLPDVRTFHDIRGHVFLYKPWVNKDFQDCFGPVCFLVQVDAGVYNMIHLNDANRMNDGPMTDANIRTHLADIRRDYHYVGKVPFRFKIERAGGDK